MMSARVSQWIAQAENAGLVVEVEQDEISRFVKIRMHEIDESNLLAMSNNSELISIHEFKMSSGKSKVSVYKYGFLVNSRKLVQKHVRYAIQGLAEGYDRYWKIQSEKAVA